MAEFDNSLRITKDDFLSLEKWVSTWGPGNQDQEFSKILKTETRKSWCAMLGGKKFEQYVRTSIEKFWNLYGVEYSEMAIAEKDVAQAVREEIFVSGVLEHALEELTQQLGPGKEIDPEGLLNIMFDIWTSAGPGSVDEEFEMIFGSIVQKVLEFHLTPFEPVTNELSDYATNMNEHQNLQIINDDSDVWEPVEDNQGPQELDMTCDHQGPVGNEFAPIEDEKGSPDDKISPASEDLAETPHLSLRNSGLGPSTLYPMVFWTPVPVPVRDGTRWRARERIYFEAESLV